MKRDLIVIKCPKCGREYLPAEIFIPKTFFGNPEFIHRDSEGKILNISGTPMNLEESYYCDNCDTALIVKCQVLFTVEIDNYNNFESDYETYINSQLSSIDF